MSNTGLTNIINLLTVFQKVISTLERHVTAVVVGLLGWLHHPMFYLSNNVCCLPLTTWNSARRSFNKNVSPVATSMNFAARLRTCFSMSSPDGVRHWLPRARMSVGVDLGAPVS